MVKKLIDSAELTKDDTVLEIGPGLGALTPDLCAQAKRVLAVELDRNFLPILKNLSGVNKNLEVINSDIFKVNFKEIGLNNFKIVSSLPYNITSLVFRYFLETGPRPQLMAVIVQKEVAERICAKPGHHTLLSLSVQLFGEPKIAHIIPRDDFQPVPEVDSAILLIKNIKQPENIKDIKKFFQLLRVGFSAKRKKLSNNLQNGLKLDKKQVEKMLISAKLNSNCRAQELSLKDWILLFDQL
jgi:16S rRNA (adenine1518-N6/adenine1519-N6)-dimethyltransferase